MRWLMHYFTFTFKTDKNSLTSLSYAQQKQKAISLYIVRIYEKPPFIKTQVCMYE